MLKSDIKVVLISEGKDSSRHFTLNSILLSFVCFAAITLLFSTIWLYSYVSPERPVAGNDFVLMNNILSPEKYQVSAHACNSEDNDAQDSKENLVKKEVIELKEKVKKLQEIEEKLMYMEKILEKKGISKELSIGGLYLAPDNPDRLSGKYLDSISKRTEDAIRILRTYPIGAPIDNPISSLYGYRVDPFKKKRAFHSGIDFSASSGTPVKTTADGIVAVAGRYGGYGKCVIIRHKNGFKTLYAHLSKIKVVKGQKVLSGDEVGKVGSTGRSTGPHLHYEIMKNGKRVNPKKYIDMG